MKDECLNAGMRGFFNKPITMKELNLLIAKYHFRMDDHELKEFLNWNLSLPY